LDINNIKATIPATPTTFFDRIVGGPGFVVPQQTGGNTILYALPWLMGNADGISHSAAPGTSPPVPHSLPWAGPSAQVMDDAFYRRYHQVWKLDKGMIASHIAHWADPGYQVPTVIATWPGNGDVTNDEPAKLAPFADLNDNGIYEPGQGEYPLIRGDQAVYSVQHAVQDYDNLHPPMDLDLHLMYYSYADSSDVDTWNTVFENVQVINRGTGTYSGVRFGMYMDFDIGGAFDDAGGCDSLLNLFYAYNGDDNDEPANGYPGYGSQPPAQGALYLNETMTAHRSDNSAQNVSLEDLMNGTASGQPLEEAGYPSHFQFPGGAFTDNVSGDTKSVGSIGPYSLAPGDTLCIDIAYPYANAASGGAIASVAALKARAQALRDWYAMQDMSCSSYPEVFAGIPELRVSTIALYPNPTNGSITLERAEHGEGALVQVHAMSGRLVMQTDWRASSTRIGLDVSSLPAGIYALEVRTQEGVQVRRLVKQ
jgi:hypothetical protein